MSDEELERLGDKFVNNNIGDKYGITFAQYVELNKCGQWQNFERGR